MIFKAALTRFEAGIQSLRRLREPSSTGGTPYSSSLESSITANSPVRNPLVTDSNSTNSDSNSISNSTSNSSTNPTSRGTSNNSNITGNNEANWQNTGFSQQQWTALQGLLRSVSGPPGEQAPPGHAAGTTLASRWNASDMGFFNPMYKDKSVASDASPMEYTPKKTYFRDMHLFLEYARDVASIKNNKLIRTNL